MVVDLAAADQVVVDLAVVVSDQAAVAFDQDILDIPDMLDMAVVVDTAFDPDTLDKAVVAAVVAAVDTAFLVVAVVAVPVVLELELELVDVAATVENNLAHYPKRLEASCLILLLVSRRCRTGQLIVQ